MIRVLDPARRYTVCRAGPGDGDRPSSARDRATTAAAAEQGVDLLPVLRTRQEAVDEAVTALFPRVRSSRSRSSVDAGGYWAGRAAADSADVGSRRSPLR